MSVGSKHRRRALIASNRSISGEGGDLAIGGNDFVGHVKTAVFDTLNEEPAQARISLVFFRR